MTVTKVDDIAVVDTDVISFIFKGDTRAVLYETHLDGRLQIIAAQTLAELERWSLTYNWGVRRRNDLRVYLNNFTFAEVDRAICLRWAEVKASAQKQGHPISVSDAWIAATALAYDVPLITHNPNDFMNVYGLIIITEL